MPEPLDPCHPEHKIGVILNEVKNPSENPPQCAGDIGGSNMICPPASAGGPQGGESLLSDLHKYLRSFADPADPQIQDDLIRSAADYITLLESRTSPVGAEGVPPTSELDALRALVKRHEDALEYLFDNPFGEHMGIHNFEMFFFDKFGRDYIIYFDEQPLNHKEDETCFYGDTPLAAIEAAKGER